MVPRDREVTAIRAALDCRADVCGVLIFGEPGVGKTTLARSVTQSLRMPAHWVAGAESARSVPLGIFANLLSSPMSGDPVAMLADAFETVRREHFSVLGVDDIHLVDPLSATLVHQLAVEGSVRIVATARIGEPIPDTITALWKDGYLTRLDVGPFDKTESVELIESALAGRLERLSADLVWEASGGNALFMRHLIDGALETGALRQVNGVWQLRGQTTVTSQLAELLSDRVDRLPDDEKRALQFLAVAEPLALGILTELVAPDTLERAERRGLIRIDDGGTDVHFTHALLGEVIRHGLGAVAGRRVKAELLAAMTGHPPRTPADRMSRAEMTVQAGLPLDSAELIRAAEDALALTNIPLAERLARAAVDAGGGLLAGEVLARSLIWQGRTVEAEAILNGYDPESLSEFELARWGIARVANLQWVIGDTDAAADVLAMLQRRIVHRGLRLVVDGLAAALLVLDCRLPEALESAHRVVDEPDAPAVAIGWAVFGGAMAAALMGRTAEAAELLARGHDVQDRIDGMSRFLMAFGEIRSLTLAGEFDAAQARSGDVVRITSNGQYRARAMANVLAGTVELGRGQLCAAIGRLEETIASLHDETAAAWSLPARLLLAQSYCGLGRYADAAPLVAELREHAERGGTMFQAPVRIAESWLAAAEGHLSGAIATALHAADLAAETGQRAIELMALHAAARFGDRSCLNRLVDVAASIDGPLAVADRAHAVGLLDSDGAAVFAAAAEFERIGAHLSAADAAAQAAALFERAGQRRQALEAAAIANRLATNCGGLRTPALCAASQPLPLSPREREIAHLVSLGMTNREIAERLVVSARTVENHLYRMFAKLDVTDRDELAALIRSGG